MPGIKPAVRTFAALALAIGGLIASTAASAHASTMLCQYQVASVSGGQYKVQNNEWGSSAAECIATDGGADFSVARSAIANQTDGAPGGYPDIFTGCHYGNCTTGGLAASPLLLAGLGFNNVTTSWRVSAPGGTANAYDVAYDIWINRTPTASGAANGTEIMIWLASHGPVQPGGNLVASGISIGGNSYNIWYRAASGGADLVTYQMTSERSSVTNLSIGSLIVNAELSGYTSPSWYLISVQAGFEIWRGGAGLATTSFAVSLASALHSRPSPGTGTAPPRTTSPYR